MCERGARSTPAALETTAGVARTNPILLIDVGRSTTTKAPAAPAGKSYINFIADRRRPWRARHGGGDKRLQFLLGFLTRRNAHFPVPLSPPPAGAAYIYIFFPFFANVAASRRGAAGKYTAGSRKCSAFAFGSFASLVYHA